MVCKSLANWPLTPVKEFKMQSVMLACSFKGSHTAENILSMYLQVTDSFNLDGKITSVVTDKASNMTKVFQHSDSDNESESEDEDLDMSLSFDFDYLSEHLPCFLHSLQLVVNDGWGVGPQWQNGNTLAFLL